MPGKAPNVNPGEEWTYRATAGQVPTRVRVTKTGTKRPPRVKVRFLDDAFEGREEWVPPSRLKVLWSDVAEWQAREDHWNAIAIPSKRISDTAELWAVETVIEIAAPEDVLSVGYGNLAGILSITDSSKAAELLNTDPSVFLADVLSFVDDDGTIVAPWSTTLAVVKAAAPRYAVPILQEVAKRERKAADHAIYGELLGSRRARPWYISPEVCAEVDARWVPTYEILRQWCGKEAVDQFNELKMLRAEVLRIGHVAEGAITVLEQFGHEKEAKALKVDLGVSVEVLRANRRRP